MPLTKLPTSGELDWFPAGTWNTLVDVARQSQRERALFGRGALDDPFGSIRWRNDSGGEAPAGAIVRPTGVLDVSNCFCLTGNKPDGTLRPVYGVNYDIVPDGAIGRLSLLSPAGAYYYTSDGTPAFGEWWGPEPSQWYLRKNRPGWMILGGASGTGSQARVKAISLPILSVIGKLAGSLSQGSSATVNVWGGAGGSEAVISGLTLTARDWFMKSGATAIASGSKVKCEMINGVWYVTQAECP